EGARWHRATSRECPDRCRVSSVYSGEEGSMKKLACAVTAAFGLVLAATGPTHAHEDDWRGHDHRFEERREFHRWGGPRIFIGVGPSITWGPAYAYGAYPAPNYRYTAPPPTYWYFCPSYGVYYPDVTACPEPWVPVPAR